MKRAIVNGKYIQQPTDDDLEGNARRPDNAQFHRDADREDHYKDIIQPFIGGKPNSEFARAYPNSVKDYYTDDEIKEL